MYVIYIWHRLCSLAFGERGLAANREVHGREELQMNHDA